MSNYFVGKEHTELSNWLRQTWLKEGPPVYFIEGFSGVGKNFYGAECCAKLRVVEACHGKHA